MFGPESREVLDSFTILMMHLAHLYKLSQSTAQKAPYNGFLTSDHGATPIYEYTNKRGISFAQRIDEENVKVTTLTITYRY